MSTEPIRILLADDNETMIVYESVLHHFLPGEMARPVEVTRVLDGLSALRCLREQRFDALVTDISMQGLDGWELLERLRAGQTEAGPESTPRGIPAAIMTAHALADDRARAQRVAADAYFAKPIEPHRFVREMTRLLRANMPE